VRECPGERLHDALVGPRLQFRGERVVEGKQQPAVLGAQ
jgi:hypothetical protein